MTPDALYEEFVKGFPARRFSAGLLVAFIDFLMKLEAPKLKAKNLEDVLIKHPRQTITAAGKRANTLIVSLSDGGTVSLRPFYNEVERFFRSENKRFDYPSCAPHATQAWGDYMPWLDALVTFNVAQLTTLRGKVLQFVLDTLKNQAFDPASVRHDPPLFQLLLDGFEMTARRGEPTGAAFQGMVFGFLRADNPHLQIEIDKVRTGSKRLQRIADIDGWEGARLAISAEVKQYELKTEDVAGLESFANETGRRGALGVIAALGFKEGVREQLEGMGIKPLGIYDMLRIVELWDPLKQRTAAASMVYYARHVEKNSSLAERIDAFLLKAAKQKEGEP
ncbi:MAG: hypothetical protein ING98_20520 [Rhodocyclaceae bacterium]|nr:hypothetical protein [Rhodocyclaceae bacterium]MCA3848694.1 hypothetical protein [Burkholderia sp.]